MSLLILRDPQGREIFSRQLDVMEANTFYQRWMDAETITVEQQTYRVHSVARTRPEGHVILCVSLVELDASEQ